MSERTSAQFVAEMRLNMQQAMADVQRMREEAEKKITVPVEAQQAAPPGEETAPGGGPSPRLYAKHFTEYQKRIQEEYRFQDEKWKIDDKYLRQRLPQQGKEVMDYWQKQGRQALRGTQRSFFDEQVASVLKARMEEGNIPKSTADWESVYEQAGQGAYASWEKEDAAKVYRQQALMRHERGLQLRDADKGDGGQGGAGLLAGMFGRYIAPAAVAGMSIATMRSMAQAYDNLEQGAQTFSDVARFSTDQYQRFKTRIKDRAYTDLGLSALDVVNTALPMTRQGVSTPYAVASAKTAREMYYGLGMDEQTARSYLANAALYGGAQMPSAGMLAALKKRYGGDYDVTAAAQGAMALQQQAVSQSGNYYTDVNALRFQEMFHQPGEGITPVVTQTAQNVMGQMGARGSFLNNLLIRAYMKKGMNLADATIAAATPTPENFDLIKGEMTQMVGTSEKSQRAGWLAAGITPGEINRVMKSHVIPGMTAPLEVGPRLEADASKTSAIGAEQKNIQTDARAFREGVNLFNQAVNIFEKTILDQNATGHEFAKGVPVLGSLVTVLDMFKQPPVKNVPAGPGKTRS